MREKTDTIYSSGKWHRDYLQLDNISYSYSTKYRRLAEAERESIIYYLGFDWICPSLYEHKKTPKWARKHLKK
jgi:hypothetical protein